MRPAWFEVAGNNFPKRRFLALLFLLVFSNSAFAYFEFTSEDYDPGAPAHAGDTQVTAVTKRYGSLYLKQTKLKKRRPRLKPGRLSWSQLKPRLEGKTSPKNSSSKTPAKLMPTSRQSGAVLLNSSN